MIYQSCPSLKLDLYLPMLNNPIKPEANNQIEVGIGTADMVPSK